MQVESLMRLTVREAACLALQKGVRLSTFLVEAGFGSLDDLDN